MTKLTCDVCRVEINGGNQGQTTADNVICGDCLERLRPWLEYADRQDKKYRSRLFLEALRSIDFLSKYRGKSSGSLQPLRLVPRPPS